MGNSNFITPWQEAHTIVGDVMAKGNRSVSIYISPDDGMSVSVFPWPGEETLREAYEQGKITRNDYRKKLGLDPTATRLAPSGAHGMMSSDKPNRLYVKSVAPIVEGGC